MRTRLGGSGAGKAGWAGWLALSVLFSRPAFPASPAHPALAFAQVLFEQAVAGLSSSDPKVRLRSASLLRQSAYAEAAVPLAKLIGDSDNAVQLEAIAAEVSIFAAVKNTTPQAAFDAGSLALGTAPIAPEILQALRRASRDESPKVAVEALYAFGALGSQASGRARHDLLQDSLADLTAVVNLPDPAVRLAAVRTIGRLYARRAGDPRVDPQLSNLVIGALNENDRAMKSAAMEALGEMRDPRAVDGLTQLFRFYQKGDLAEGAIGALSRIGDRSSAPLFLMLLSDKSPALKAFAIEGLARTGDPGHMEAIRASLKREHDARVIGAIEFAEAMLADGPIEQIVDALNRPKTHDTARGFLSEIAPGRVMRMSRYAQDPTPRIRADVADIVGLSDDPQGILVVAPLLADMDRQVALAAERATRRLQSIR